MIRTKHVYHNFAQLDLQRRHPGVAFFGGICATTICSIRAAGQVRIFLFGSKAPTVRHELPRRIRELERIIFLKPPERMHTFSTIVFHYL